MNHIIKQVTTSLVIAGLVFCFTTTRILAVNYGEGRYGVGIYNVGDVPSASPSTNSNTDSPPSNTPSTPSCTQPVPSGTPDLFQINSSSPTGVKVFFAPVAGNTDRYYVSYSTNASAEEFGAEFPSNSQGVIALNIQALKANTVYYFKVRAGNGCMPGAWSSVLAAKAGQRVPTYRWKSFSKIVSNTVATTKNPTAIEELYVRGEEVNVITKPTIEAPASDTSSQGVIKKTATTAQPPSNTTAQPTTSPNIFQKIGNFFSSLFKR